MLSLRWARDHQNNPIGWAAFGVKGPTLATPNADPEVEWLGRLRKDFRLPSLVITTKGLHTKFGASIHVSSAWDLLRNARAVELVALALEHQPAKGVVIDAGDDRLSARINDAAYARVGGRVYESCETITWAVLDDLEDRRETWSAIMIPEA